MLFLLAGTAGQRSTLLTETQRRAIERKCPFCHTGTQHIVDRIPAGERGEMRLVARADTS